MDMRMNMPMDMGRLSDALVEAFAATEESFLTQVRCKIRRRMRCRVRCKMRCRMRSGPIR